MPEVAGSDFKVNFTGYFPWATSLTDHGVIEITSTTKVTVDPLQLTISAPDLKIIKQYDGNDTATVIKVGDLENIVGTDDVKSIASATYDSHQADIGKKITVKYALTGGEAGNYLAPADFEVNTGEITKKPITITAQAKEKFYGDTDPELNYEYPFVDLVGTDKLIGDLSRESGENAGTYKINQGDLDNPNYDITYEAADFTIKQAPLIIQIDEITKVYGAVDPELTYQVVFGDVVGDDMPIGSFERVAGENVGEYDISQGTFTFDDNYDVFVNNGKLTINPAPITVTADAVSKVVGSNDPDLTYKITSGTLQEGDVLTGAITRATGENVGLYEINVGTLANSNYVISFIKGIFSIIEKAVEAVTVVEKPTPDVETPAIVAGVTVATADPSASVLGTVDTGEPDSAGVAGNEEGADVKSATDKKEEVKKVWGIFGVAWYWWLLIIAALGASAWWWFAGAKLSSDDKTTNSTK